MIPADVGDAGAPGNVPKSVSRAVRGGGAGPICRAAGGPISRHSDNPSGKLVNASAGFRWVHMPITRRQWRLERDGALLRP